MSQKDLKKVQMFNSVVTRCFRNVADQDYIAARLNFRHGLVLQFYWAALQAIEKYLKAILLYNRIGTKPLNHNLVSAYSKVRDLDTFEFRLSDSSHEFLKDVDVLGNNRYLQRSYSIEGYTLAFLDRTIWEIRRYCQILNPKFTHDPHLYATEIAEKLKQIERSTPDDPTPFPLGGGRLEFILEQKGHLAREPLIWHNLYFSSVRRRRVGMPPISMFENTPLFIHSDIVNDLKPFMKLPFSVLP